MTSDIINTVKLTNAIDIYNVVTYLLIDIKDSSYLTFSAAVVKARPDSRPNNKKPLFCSLKQKILLDFAKIRKKSIFSSQWWFFL